MYFDEYEFAGFDPRSQSEGREHGRVHRGRGFGFRSGGGDAGEEQEAMLGRGRGHGHRGRDRHDFGPGGRGRSERMLGQGDLRWLVLDLIANQPRHGYEIIKAIEEEFGGHYSPSPGVIYPTLTFLEETGLIASEPQATKKLYTITDEGRAALEANSAELTAMKEKIGLARARFGDPPAPELIRAMDNLRAAISVRLAKGQLSPESLAAITAALDRAASEIERS